MYAKLKSEALHTDKKKTIQTNNSELDKIMRYEGELKK